MELSKDEREEYDWAIAILGPDLLGDLEETQEEDQKNKEAMLAVCKDLAEIKKQLSLRAGNEAFKEWRGKAEAALRIKQIQHNKLMAESARLKTLMSEYHRRCHTDYCYKAAQEIMTKEQFKQFKAKLKEAYKTA